MGSQYPGNRRSDEQLEAILFEAANWTVNGRNGQVLCTTPSLQHALGRAADFAASGAVVVAICRAPAENIVIFEGQAQRLRKLCVDREVALFEETHYRGIPPLSRRSNSLRETS